MRCKNCNELITDEKAKLCPFCGEMLEGVSDKTIAINKVKESTLEDDINKEIEKSNDEVIIVDGSIIQEESILDDITSDSSISNRKRTFFISLGIVACLLLIIGAIIILLPDSKGNKYNYLKELETGMKEIYEGKETDRLNKVLEYVADDDEKLNEVHNKSNVIASKWVEDYKSNDLDNSQAFKDAEYNYLNIINKIYEYNYTNKSNDIVRIFAVNDYNTLAKSIEKIYEDGKTYYEALEYYHGKDYNNAYYMFGRVEVETTYYQQSRKYLETISNDIMTLLNNDIKKIEVNINEDNYEDSLKKYAQILDIIIGYNTVYENVKLTDNTDYNILVQKYNDKVSEFTEKISSGNKIINNEEPVNNEDEEGE